VSCVRRIGLPSNLRLSVHRCVKPVHATERVPVQKNTPSEDRIGGRRIAPNRVLLGIPTKETGWEKSHQVEPTIRIRFLFSTTQKSGWERNGCSEEHSTVEWRYFRHFNAFWLAYFSKEKTKRVTIHSIAFIPVFSTHSPSFASYGSPS
jgi:hypothetical protein